MRSAPSARAEMTVKRLVGKLQLDSAKCRLDSRIDLFYLGQYSMSGHADANQRASSIS
jgi:hypothetical protein